ncbi:hypothetical protein YC2023_124177 [Brassica napus]
MTPSHPVRSPETSSSGEAYPRPRSDILFSIPAKRVGSNENFGEKEEEAAAQSLEAPRRILLSFDESNMSSAKTTTRSRVTTPTDLHAGDGFGYDGVGKGPLTVPNGTGEAIWRKAKGDAKSRLGRRNWGRVSLTRFDGFMKYRRWFSCNHQSQSHRIDLIIQSITSKYLFKMLKYIKIEFVKKVFALWLIPPGCIWNNDFKGSFTERDVIAAELDLPKTYIYSIVNTIYLLYGGLIAILFCRI